MNRSSLTTVLCTIGTRPEAIKMAPLIKALKLTSWARCRVVCTGQHRDLVAPILKFFGIESDIDLDSMRPGQSPVDLCSRLVESLRGIIASVRPDMVLAQGDTTSVLAAAWASFHHKVPFGHVEAGLRSGDLYSPLPEEANRVVASHLSEIHFAPTITARANLMREGIKHGSISLTGNTVIDALLHAARLDRPVGVRLDPKKKLILVTAHRRDCIGEPLRQICHAILILHDMFDDVEFLWPVHPNPSVRSIVVSKMSGRPRVRLCEPLGYAPFVSAMKRATLILTDSGGIQEEAPALGKPVLVLRPNSERPEAVDSGVALLVGYEPGRIVAQTSRLLTDAAAYSSMADGKSPYGDGQAAARIVSAIARFLGVSQPVRAAG